MIPKKEKGVRSKEFKFLAKFYRIPSFVFLILDTKKGERSEE
jgi:hypothetical protein